MSEIDCNRILERLWAYLDGEADAAAAADLEAHITACLGCRDHADFEARLRQIVQMKCRGEKAPDRLRAHLHRLLSHSP